MSTDLSYTGHVLPYSTNHEDPVYQPPGTGDETYSSQWHVQDASRLTRRLERLEFLCMLERDGQISHSGLICSACCTTHEVEFFSEDALHQESRIRQCLGRVGRVWICPHATIGYDQLELIYQGLQNHHCYPGSGLYMTAYPSRPFVEWPLIHAPSGTIPLLSEVSKILSSLDAQVCPHRQLKDPLVLLRYDQTCRNLETNFCQGSWSLKCRCRACTAPEMDCTICQTQILFGFEMDRDYRRALFPHIARHLQPHQCPTDAAWIAQLSYPRDFSSLRKAWKQTVDRCKQTASRDSLSFDDSWSDSSDESDDSPTGDI